MARSHSRSHDGYCVVQRCCVVKGHHAVKGYCVVWGYVCYMEMLTLMHFFIADLMISQRFPQNILGWQNTENGQFPLLCSTKEELEIM